MTKTVQDYQDEIQNAQSEIYKLQFTCSHPEYYVAMYSWRPGAINPHRLCKTCELPLSGITVEESNKAWDDYWKPLKESSGDEPYSYAVWAKKENIDDEKVD